MVYNRGGNNGMMVTVIGWVVPSHPPSGERLCELQVHSLF